MAYVVRIWHLIPTRPPAQRESAAPGQRASVPVVVSSFRRQAGRWCSISSSRPNVVTSVRTSSHRWRAGANGRIMKPNYARGISQRPVTPSML